MPTLIILESSLHKFVSAPTLQQLIREQTTPAAAIPGESVSVEERADYRPSPIPLSNSAPQLPSTKPSAVPAHMSSDTVSPAPSLNRRPVKSSSTGALAKTARSSSLGHTPVIKQNPLVTRPRDTSSLSPQPNKLMVKSASSPKPSRRLHRYRKRKKKEKQMKENSNSQITSHSKEKEREQAENELFNADAEPRYSRLPNKRNSLIREASIENITPGPPRSPSPSRVRSASVELPSPRGGDISDPAGT